MAALKPPFRAADMEGLYKRVQKGVCDRIPSKYSSDLMHVNFAHLIKNEGYLDMYVSDCIIQTIMWAALEQLIIFAEHIGFVTAYNGNKVANPKRGI